MSSKTSTARLSVRIDLPGGGRFGPGKAALLKSIDETGSISAAARAMNMSYPRALRLIEDMNALFPSPLVETRHGGADRGGAALSDLGRRAVEAYDALTASAHAATEKERAQLLKLMADF